MTKGLLLRSWCGFLDRCDVDCLEPCLEVIQPVRERRVAVTDLCGGFRVHDGLDSLSQTSRISVVGEVVGDPC